MLCCQYCGKGLATTSAVCDCQSKPKIDNGGPAFPQLTSSPLPYGASRVEVAGGMTLRDYFAGQALAGIMANPVRWADIQRRYDQGKLSYDDASHHNAVKAYNIADAMLTERAKGGQ